MVDLSGLMEGMPSSRNVIFQNSFTMCHTLAQVYDFFALVKLDTDMNSTQDSLFDTNTKRIYNDCTPIPIHKISLTDDKTNRLGIMGAVICCEMNNHRRKKDYLLPYLTGLRIDYGWHLERSLAKMDCGLGDTSWVYAVNENGEEDKDQMHFLKRFRIVNDDGFWQMYLLYNAERVMPVWWHGLYVVRGYVFTLSDIRLIENMEDSDKETFSKKKLLLPKVNVIKNSANIKVTYWSDHDGFCRETVKITIDDDGRLTSIKRTKQEVLVPSNICICY